MLLRYHKCMIREQHFAVGDLGDVALIEPSDGEPHAAVICVQTPSIQLLDPAQSAKQLACDEFVIAVPDSARFATDVAAHTAALRDWLDVQTNVRPNRIAIWAFGGDIGPQAAVVPGLAAAVIFLSDSDADAGGHWWPDVDPAAVRCPLLLVLYTHLADDSEQVRSLRDMFAAAHVRAEVQTYAGTDAPTQGRVFDAAAVADAWDLVAAFLHRSLER